MDESIICIRTGKKVCILERGELAGREQEWNISLQELEDLVEAGALTSAGGSSHSNIYCNM